MRLACFLTGFFALTSACSPAPVSPAADPSPPVSAAPTQNPAVGNAQAQASNRGQNVNPGASMPSGPQAWKDSTGSVSFTALDFYANDGVGSKLETSSIVANATGHDDSSSSLFSVVCTSHALSLNAFSLNWFLLDPSGNFSQLSAATWGGAPANALADRCSPFAVNLPKLNPGRYLVISIVYDDKKCETATSSPFCSLSPVQSAADLQKPYLSTRSRLVTVMP